MSSSGADPLQQLVDSFRSLLDEGLVLAIANDHDLNKESEYQATEAILQGLAENVAIEEASGFNPGGIPTDATNAEDAAQSSNGQSSSATSVTNAAGQTAAKSTATESSGTEVSSQAADVAGLGPRLTCFDDDTEEGKATQLHAVFPELKRYDALHALRKAKGDFQAALDDLLNIQDLKSKGELMKGIDGFFHTDEQVSRRGKGKKKTGKTSSDSDSSSTQTFGAGNASAIIKHQDEITYLADAFDLPFAEVSSIYGRKRYAMGATAVEILDRYISHGIVAEDEERKKHAHELAKEYDNVPKRYMLTLVQVCGPVPESADEVAAILAKHFKRHPETTRVDFNYLRPLNDENIEGAEQRPNGKKGVSGIKQSGGYLTSASRSSASMDLDQAIQLGNAHTQAGRNAWESAAQLNRRGASNPLYRQAAGYYVEQARVQSRHARQANSLAADLQLDGQSTATQVDLHGVSVQDGVRYARQSVQAWWDGLGGEFRSRKARDEPYTVITGIGRHSAGGVSQMRQAVAAALLRDGWRVQAGTGRFHVDGRR